MKYSDLEEFLLNIKKAQMEYKLYVWGIGYYGNMLGRLFNENQIIWHGYYDNLDNTEKKMLNYKPIFDGKQIDKGENVIYCLAMKPSLANIVGEKLLADGVDESRIFSFEGTKVFMEIEDCTFLGMKEIEIKLKKFRNLHKGKKCFVIGNGPSLRIEDLETIQRENVVTLASNYIFNCYEKTTWRPNYYFVVDSKGVRRFFQDEVISNLISKNCEYVFSYDYVDESIPKIDNMVLFNYRCSNEEPIFSSDCEKQVYTGKTVTFTMLQIAAYMGFSEIYLLGMDHTFSTEIKADGTVIHNNIKDHSNVLNCGNVLYYHIDGATKAYMAAKEYADAHDIKIYNATRGGHLEVFPRVDFDTLF